MSDFISPVRIEAMAVRKMNFEVYPPEEEGGLATETTTSLSIKMGSIEKNSNCNRYMLSGEVEVAPTVFDKSDARDKRISANVVIMGAISVPDKFGEKYDEKKIEQYLQLNLLSLFYSHARTIIMTALGWSPLKGLILPAIDPAEYLRGFYEQQQKNQDTPDL